MDLTVEVFADETQTALQNYERFVVCLEKTPEQFKSSLESLMGKAVKAFLNRGPNLRHGIAADRQMTVIISQTNGDRPLCGIYFNLFSPYLQAAGKGSD